jgi:hypothetical protein
MFRLLSTLERGGDVQSHLNPIGHAHGQLLRKRPPSYAADLEIFPKILRKPSFRTPCVLKNLENFA